MTKAKRFLLLAACMILIAIMAFVLWKGFHANEQGASSQSFSDSIPTYPQEAEDLYAANNLLLTDSIQANEYSLRTDLDLRVSEFNDLKEDIDSLENHPAGGPVLDSMMKRVLRLEAWILKLREELNIEEAENTKFRSGIEKNTSATVKKPVTAKLTTRPATSRQLPDSRFILPAPTAMKLSALTLEDGKELETTNAGLTSRLYGQFTLRNTSPASITEEIMVAVTRPDGKVIQHSWDSGTFQTAGGRKIYSVKLLMRAVKGETRHLEFSIGTDDFQRGVYTMHVYHIGVMIGKTTRLLY